jgi:EmrB/QacA subfamily drug resistance transporter
MLNNPSPEQLTAAQRSMILFSSSLGGFVVTLMTSGINVGLPDIGHEFSLSGVYLNWISLSMVLISAAVLLPIGRLADAYGRMRFFVGGMVIFSAASFACALAPSAGVLVAFRMVSGIGLAVGSVTAPALVILAYPLEKRGHALGWNVLGVYLGITVGPLLGGVIFRNLDWRAFFYILAAVNLTNIILPVWKLRHIEWKETAQGRFDLPGSLLFAVGLVCVLLGLSSLPKLTGVVFLVVGVAGLAGFFWWETRAADPLLPVRLLKRNRVFGAANAAVLVNYAATAAMSLLLSYYLIVNRGLAEDIAGLLIATGSFVQAITSPFAGRLADRVEARYVASVGMGLCVLGLFALIFLGPATPYWYVALALCVIGLGFGLFSAPITHAVMGSVDRSQVGMASATMSVVRQAGMNLSIGLATMLIALYVAPLHLDITPDNYPVLRAPFLTTIRLSFIIFTALCAVGIVASLVGPRRGERSRN